MSLDDFDKNNIINLTQFDSVFFFRVGTTQFCAVINPPQSCILAVGGAQQRIVPDPDSDQGWKQSVYISVTLSCDHRSVDGAVGARWLQYFQKFMEDPHSMLL